MITRVYYLLLGGTLAALGLYGAYSMGVSHGSHSPSEASSPEPTQAAGQMQGSQRDDHADSRNSLRAQTPRDLIERVRRSLQASQAGPLSDPAVFKALASLGELSADEVPAALEAVEELLPESNHKSMFRLVLMARWAESDGAAAMNHAQEQFGSNPLMDPLKHAVTRAWAKQDPEGAWKWYLGARESEPRAEKNLKGIFAALGEQDLSQALQRLQDLEDHEQELAWAGLSTQSWDQEYRDQLIAQVENLPPVDQETAMNSIVKRWAMMDPDAALAWVQTLPAEQGQAYSAAVGPMLMLYDGPKGAELMLGAAQPSQRPAAYLNVVRHWLQQDPHATGQWLGRQERSPELDPALHLYSNAVFELDPGAAMQWAMHTSDEGNRLRSVQSIFQRWRRKDDAGARQALEQAGLSAPEMASVLSARRR